MVAVDFVATSCVENRKANVDQKNLEVMQARESWGEVFLVKTGKLCMAASEKTYHQTPRINGYIMSTWQWNIERDSTYVISSQVWWKF